MKTNRSWYFDEFFNLFFLSLHDHLEIGHPLPIDLLLLLLFRPSIASIRIFSTEIENTRGDSKRPCRTPLPTSQISVSSSPNGPFPL
jgi:hypothetical protein